MLSNWYKQYVLGTLTFTFTLNSLDVGLMILFLQPIKNELHLSDTQLGFVTGIAFGLFYATLGLPFARWADRADRVTITSIAIGLWGITVMSCLFVTNFLQLVVARLVAGVGESGCMPAAYSLLGDYFPAPSERIRAMTIFMLANPLTPLVSFILGGWLNERFGWRIAFAATGVAGMLVAVIVKMTIREPRKHMRDVRNPQEPQARIRDVIWLLWRQRSCRHLSLAIILILTTGFGISPWYAAFMMRSHGMNIAEIGVWFGLIFGIGGVLGTLSGGYMAHRWFANDERSQLRFIGIVVGSLFPLYVLFLMLPQKVAALITLVPLMMVFNFFYGPTFALLQRLVDDKMRATAMAVVMLLANLIGLGVGPQSVGVLSDLLMPTFGSESLRYAMLALALLSIAAAYHFWRAAQTVGQDLLWIDERIESRTADRGDKDASLVRIAVADGGGTRGSL